VITAVSLLEPPQPSTSDATVDDTGVAAMLAAGEPLPQTHALVIGHHTLELLCGLISRGCAAALEMKPQGRLPAEPAELVLIPDIDTLDAARNALLLARRALLPCGRIVLQDRSGTQATAIADLLRRGGFSAVRVRRGATTTLITGDWPMFGLTTTVRHA